MSNAVFIRAEELAQELEISKAKAYKMIRQWNEELRAKGYATVNGRVSRQYYLEHMYGMTNKEGGRRPTSGVAIWLARRVAATRQSRGAAENGHALRQVR